MSIQNSQKNTLLLQIIGKHANFTVLQA